MIDTTEYDVINQDFSYPDLPNITSNNSILADDSTVNYLKSL
nr:MAG TPA: hypothetical protein [Crassvirales sp.]